jgi:hypothetical protein
MNSISELLNVVRAGAGVAPGAEGRTADDVLPFARAASEAPKIWRTAVNS